MTVTTEQVPPRHRAARRSERLAAPPPDKERPRVVCEPTRGQGKTSTEGYGMFPPEPKLWTGYDAESDTEFLLTVFENGERELATRPGQNNTQVRWSVPVTLTGVPA